MEIDAVETLKAKGNDAFRNRDYEAALKFYSEAIDAAKRKSESSSSSTNLHVLFSNRGQTHLQLNRPDRALQDAIHSTELNPKWLKGYYVKVKALYQLHEYEDAIEAYTEAKSNGAEPNPESNKELQDLLKLCETGSVDSYYGSRLASKGAKVSVKYIDARRGKGVFANQPFKARDIVYSEEPLVSHRFITGSKERIEACSHCWRSNIKEDDIDQRYKSKLLPVLRKVQRSFVKCNKLRVSGEEQRCDEVYCSERCRDQAWDTYHRLLCPTDRTEEVTNALVELRNIATQSARTNPIVIARAFATTIQSLESETKESNSAVGSTNKTPSEKRIKQLYRKYSNFVANEEPTPNDHTIVDLLRVIFKSQRQNIPGVDWLVTLRNYRLLHGGMLRNASKAMPLSEIQVALAEKNEECPKGTTLSCWAIATRKLIWKICSHSNKPEGPHSWPVGLSF
eukprot:TRINITY_DN1153_c0_g1_i1.p1 TRINITY_DN1153_c0_g1~~TRINITY_DN1153_c0_g1_i1.p1  ORF type:complete len:468 (-),score=96.04 TRINITY_DN1153_c0_g1_i1:905-2263(-)